jgi:hypothetical protein
MYPQGAPLEQPLPEQVLLASPLHHNHLSGLKECRHTQSKGLFLSENGFFSLRR